MKRGWLVLLLLLSAGINAGILATLALERWQGAREPRRLAGSQERPLEALADHLELRGGEREAFLEIQRRFLQVLRTERLELARLRDAIRREVTAPEPDEEALRRLTGRLAPRYLALDRALVENVLRSREILDPAQERRFFRILQRLRARGLERPLDRLEGDET